MPHVIRPIFGLEFEVSCSAFDAGGARLSPGMVLTEFMAVAAARWKHLPAHGASGMFLENGARLYLDCSKPEITTPEVLTPADACRYARAGEEILMDVCRALIDNMPMVHEIILSRCNVGYGGNGNAWACHESYGHRIERNLAEHFIPHAVSRIIYTGAGGFDNRTNVLKFLISPRVAHLRSTISGNTQRNRGIYNTKDEPLCGNGFRRLHVICGENVSSIVSQWLKMGTTAIVVAMAEAGLRPGDGLELRHPVKAMRTIAEDVTLTARVMTTRGEQLTAIDIQRRLLDKARGLDVSGTFASWFEPCCRIWKETLDRLERGPGAVERSLDWSIKLDLFKKYVERKGLSWDRLAVWNKVLARLDEESLPTAVGNDVGTLSRKSDYFRQWRRLARRHGLGSNELEAVLEVRHELYELDARFGEIGERGIFNSLDRGGFLDHGAPGVDDIQRAKREPPSEGRASLRGRVIQRCAGKSMSVACDWRGMWDFEQNRYLDLSDPFTEQETWKPIGETRPVSETDYVLRITRTMRQARALYGSGDYESAYRTLSIVREWIELLELPALTVVRDVFRFTAWAQTRRGFPGGPETLGSMAPDSTDLASICNYLAVYRFWGLTPAPEFEDCCKRGRAMIARTRSARPGAVAAVMAAHAFHLLCSGRPDDAWNAYHDALQPTRRQALHQRMCARILTEQADTLRQLGRGDEAMPLLEEAQRIQIACRCDGDIVDFTFTQRAKLAIERNDPDSARAILDDVLRAQRAINHSMGEARSLLLMARISHLPAGRPESPAVGEIRERLDAIRGDRPLLAQCVLATKIFDNWNRWVTGKNAGNESDFFWHL